MSENLPDLTPDPTDRTTLLAKGAFGAIPFAGPIAAEIIGHVIPDQRTDRIVRFVEILEERVKHLEQELFRSRCLETDAVDLIEDALFQSARATTQERIKYIANVVGNGLSAEQLELAETKRMLWLLGQLNDAQIIILRSKLVLTRGDVETDADFREKHQEILAPDNTHMGSSEEEFEEAALKTSYRQHLHDLGLLRRRFKKPKRGESPDFDDKTGIMKASGADVTRLGKMLLRYLDLIPEWYRR